MRRLPGIAVVGLLAFAVHAGAQGEAASEKPIATTGPVVSEFGPTYPVEPDFATPTDKAYRAVFDVAADPESGGVNPKIETVARFLNMHARAGLAPEQMELVLVLHGAAGKAALKNAAYRRRFDTDNPDLPLLEALRGAGVRIYLCGQTAAHRGFPKEELAQPVELALSAMTVLVRLQNDGYALIAF